MSFRFVGNNSSQLLIDRSDCSSIVISLVLSQKKETSPSFSLLINGTDYTGEFEYFGRNLLNDVLCYNFTVISLDSVDLAMLSEIVNGISMYSLYHGILEEKEVFYSVNQTEGFVVVDGDNNVVKQISKGYIEPKEYERGIKEKQAEISQVLGTKVQ